MNTKRFPLPDFLKGFAVFLIVPVHILETFIDYPGRESLFGKILLLLGGPFGVPVFMMVMGYFVSMSKKTTAQNILRGVLIFILGIFLNIGLNFHLLLKIWTEGWKFDPLQAIFSVDIFFLAGLSIILLSVLKTLKYGQQWIAFALILFISGSTAYMNEILMVTERNYILPFIGGKYSWSYFPLFPWLTYPLIGFFFRRPSHKSGNLFKNRKSFRLRSLLSFLFWLFCFPGLASKPPSTFPSIITTLSRFSFGLLELTFYGYCFSGLSFRNSANSRQLFFCGGSAKTSLHFTSSNG